MSKRLDANKLLEFIDAMEYYEYTSPSDIDTGVAVMCQKVRSKIKSGAFNADQWISVKECLPEVKGEYLVFYKYKENEYRVDIALFSRFGWHKAHAITHWMPLPEPPKDG